MRFDFDYYANFHFDKILARPRYQRTRRLWTNDHLLYSLWPPTLEYKKIILTVDFVWSGNLWLNFCLKPQMNFVFPIMIELNGQFSVKNFQRSVLFPNLYARYTWDFYRWFVGHWLYDLHISSRRSIGVTEVRIIKIKIISITLKILNLPRDWTCPKIKGSPTVGRFRPLKCGHIILMVIYETFIRFIILELRCEINN